MALSQFFIVYLLSFGSSRQNTIPSKQCQAILKQIHEGHLGLNKCKLRAKETVYWPGLNNELEDLVLNCQLCLKYSTAKHKLEPSLALGQEVPLYPWTKLATDISHFEGASYLLIVDYTSCYPVVHKLTSQALPIIHNLMG